eukprot:763841-Hanusia_phi.AAC.2
MHHPEIASRILDEAAQKLGVFVRPAMLTDSDQLIHLNQAFRYEMAQWEAELSDGDEDAGYPVLDFEDVEYILTKEDPLNLYVIGRRLQSDERLIGYSYSYLEPWESAVSTPARRTKTATPRKNSKHRASDKKQEKPPKNKSSLYLAELFVTECERGLGLGELLLSATLNQRSGIESLGSHLFVSSQNVSAVKCYMKFGYRRGNRPSGDAAHDLIMELTSCTESVLSSAFRLQHQMEQGTIGARRRRKAASPQEKDETRRSSSSSKGSDSSPTHKESLITYSKLSKFLSSIVSRSDSRASSASTLVEVSSRCSSRSSTRNSPPPVTLRPRATRCTLSEDSERRVTRAAHADSNSSIGHSSSPSLGWNEDLRGEATIVGRQRKTRRTEQNSKGDRIIEDATRRGKSTRTKDSESDVRSQTRQACKRHGPSKRFLLTGFGDNYVEKMKTWIQDLGGEYISSTTYDPSCTHVIARRQLRTEKFLSSLASGKFLLKPEYLLESVRCEHFVDERGYEWIEDSDYDVKFAEMEAKRGTRNRCKDAEDSDSETSSCDNHGKSFVSTGNLSEMTTGCFSGTVAILLAPYKRKMGYKRVLEAGGGTVRDSVTKNFSRMIDGVTHVFVSRLLIEKEDAEWSDTEKRGVEEQLKVFMDRGLRCYWDDMICDYLFDSSSTRSNDYLITIRKLELNRDKRKAKAGEQVPCKRARVQTR